MDNWHFIKLPQVVYCITTVSLIFVFLSHPSEKNHIINDFLNIHNQESHDSSTTIPVVSIPTELYLGCASLIN